MDRSPSPLLPTARRRGWRRCAVLLGAVFAGVYFSLHPSLVGAFAAIASRGAHLPAQARRAPDATAVSRAEAAKVSPEHSPRPE